MPEAIITESSTNCYGHTGTAYSLLSKQADGSWKLMSENIGIPTLLTTRDLGG